MTNDPKTLSSILCLAHEFIRFNGAEKNVRINEMLFGEREILLIPTKHLDKVPEDVTLYDVYGEEKEAHGFIDEHLEAGHLLADIGICTSDADGLRQMVQALRPLGLN